VTINTNIPSALFNANNVCDGSAVNFNDQSGGTGINGWSWDFGDPSSSSNTSTSQNPSHTFTAAGTYNVTLTVSNIDGCQGQVQNSVVVHQNPVITVADAGMCAGAQATLNGPGGFASYHWSSGELTQSITVSPGGNTSYTLTVTDSNGCTGNYTATVLVDPVPVPDAGNPQTVCEGTTVNLSGSGGTIYVWNPGNISGSNVSVSPSATTTYTLTVSSNAGCSATDDVTINVNPMPSAFAGDDIQICKGESATINAVTAAPNILWTPGNFNTPNFTVTPVATTVYILSVSDVIGCSGGDTITVTVNPLPLAQFANTSPICIGSDITFTDQSNVSSGSVTNWLWAFGDGNVSNDQNPVHQYASSGSFNVQLLVTSNSGCKDSTVTFAVVNPLPAVNAGNDDDICPGFNATLTGSGSGNYLWNPGGYTTSAITLSPSATTDYILTVTDANGCVNTDQATIVVNPVPVADAGPSASVCDGDQVTLFGNGGDSYLWTPGNINTQNYSFTPTSSGQYTLLVTNSFGCQATDQVDVQVNPIPIPALSSSGPVCQGNVVHFNDQSQVTTGSIIAWNWDFGNNTSSSIQNPTTPYYNPGTYNVSLVVYSNNGCNATTSFTQSIWATPVASFTHTDVCDGNPISFNNTSQISDATALSYSWNLGDNTTSTSSTFTHQYGGYGSYPASLVVTSLNGCVDSVNQLVNVFALPAASFNMEYACVDQPASFIDASTVPQGVISSWFWTLGDQTSSLETHPSHTYAFPGHYNVHLAVTTDHGCRDEADGIIRIVPKPSVDFATENACLGYEVDLADHSMPATGPIIQYQWNFGDGSTSNDRNPSHVYSSSGYFQVSLTATSDSGCVTTLVRPNALQIYAPPVAQFTSNSSEANDIVPLVNFLNETAGSEFFYWNFGDGDTSTQYSPAHMYEVVGKYDVQLITVDQNGCIDSVTIPIEIRPTSNVYIPNAFTPNGDTKNDIFKVYTYNVIGMDVQIYDRWGLKIVEWKDVYGGWDGKVAGTPAQADTYVYRVATVDVNNKQEVYVGHVSLVR
jgi:gliding motility-associated-like protein